MCRGLSASTVPIASRQRPEAAGQHAFPEVHVGAVVDHVPGDDETEVGDVQDAVVVRVGVADLDDNQVVPFEREPVTGDRHRGDRRWRDSGYTLSQSTGRASMLTCIWVIEPAVAMTRAPNRSANSPAANQ